MLNKYPYTDYNELNLDWFLTEFKKLYDAWLQMQQNNAQMVIKYDNMVLQFGTLTETVNTFTAFVTNYFDNLDVQQEINNKLDDMVQQGTLQPLLAPYVTAALPDVVTDQLPGVVTLQLPDEVQTQLPGVVADQIDAAVAPEVPGAVTAWLAANVNPVGSAVVVDTSLSIAGAAADAKVTGDTFDEVRGEFSETPIANYIQPFDSIIGSQVASSTGAISSSSTKSRCDYTDLKGCEKFTMTGTANYTNYCLYDENYNYIYGSTNTTGEKNRPEYAKYVIFTTSIGTIGDAILTLINVPTPISRIYDALEDKADLSDSFGETFVTEKISLQNVVGVNKFAGNLINIYECIDNYYVIASNGALSADNAYFVTNFIPVTPGETYKANAGRNYAFYDADKHYVSGAANTDIQDGLEAPAGSAFLRFTIKKTTDNMSDPFNLYCDNILTYNDIVTIPGLKVSESLTWCYGKKINWMGDSIVAGNDFDEIVCSALGLIKNYEYGINGSTIALNANGTDTRDAMCARYSSMSDDVDIIAISGGTNDFEYAWCPIGTIDDPDDGTSNNTFYGALKTLCKGLIDKYPKKVIFFTTPIKRAQPFSDGDGGTYTPDNVMLTPFSKNKYGLTLGDYADIIKEVCGYYSIPVLDLYRESMLNPSLTSQQDMFDAVYTHPNTDGRKMMARRVAGWLSTLEYGIE